MSFTKKSSNATQVGLKKCLNLTAQVSDAIASYNKKAGWNNKTCKLIKTLTNQSQKHNPNIMTQDDIDQLFGKKRAVEKRQNGEYEGKYRDFVRSVKFLQVDDDYDKFLTGIPHLLTDQNRIGLMFSANAVEPVEDLTVEFKKNYLVGKVIGEGAYASVRVAIFKPQNKKIAIKIYEKSKLKQTQRKKSVRRQIKILELLNHPNIVKILQVVESNNHLNIVMEYLAGTSLGSYLKLQHNSKMCEQLCKRIFLNLGRALAYMHSINIAHRDIKLENIILDQELNPKIIDFGFSTCIEKGKKIKIFCGTPSYMSPEVVQRKDYRGEGADVWALGVMLFVCLTGIFPFKGSTDQELYKKINNSDYPRGELLFSRSLSDLMEKMLKINPDERISSQQLLKHPWFIENKCHSSNKKTTQVSLENRKRIHTVQSNISKENKWGHKSGGIRKILAQTLGNQNLKLEIKMAVKSPKMRQQINSYRLNEKENTIKLLKSQKNTFRYNPNSENKENEKKHMKTQSKVIDLLKTQMRKIEIEKSRSKRKA